MGSGDLQGGAAHRGVRRREALVARRASPSGIASGCVMPNDLTFSCSRATTSRSTWSCTAATTSSASRRSHLTSSRSEIACGPKATPRFYELNDASQHLGNVAFRPPVPAYRHSAALFLRMRGWLTSDATPPSVPRRPQYEETLLRECGERARPVVSARRWPQVKRIRTAEDFIARLEALHDRRCRSPTRRTIDGPRRPDRGRRPPRAEPLRDPSDGGLGRHRRRAPD